MASASESSAKRLATDLLIAAVHNGRFYPAGDIQQETQAEAQTHVLAEAYQGLLEGMKALKIKEATSKRAVVDLVIAAVHNGRYLPAASIPVEDIHNEQVHLITQACQALADMYTKS